MRALAPVAVLLAVACASPGKVPDPGDMRRGGGDAAKLSDMITTVDDGGTSDGAIPFDAAQPVDLAGRDLSGDMTSTCTPRTQPCDLVCQNGCGSGGKCTLVTGDVPGCVAAGTVGEFAACGTHGFDDCVAGGICLGESTQLSLSLCRPFCRVDGDCPTNAKCDIQVVNSSGTVVTTVCSEPVTNCDPVKMTGCNSGSCYIVTPDGQTGCHVAGTGGQGASCDSDYACKPGFGCFGAQGMMACAKLCHAGNSADCATGQMCVGVTGPNGAWTTYGACN